MKSFKSKSENGPPDFAATKRLVNLGMECKMKFHIDLGFVTGEVPIETAKLVGWTEENGWPSDCMMYSDDRDDGWKPPPRKPKEPPDNQLCFPFLINEISLATSNPADMPTKDKSNTTPFWTAIRDLWIQYYKDRYGLEPTFRATEATALQSIMKRLQKHTENSPKSKDQEWTEEYAKRVFTYFLELAYKNSWLQRNFRLPILSQSFDSIVASNGTKHPTTKPATGAEVDSNSAFRKIATLAGMLREPGREH